MKPIIKLLVFVVIPVKILASDTSDAELVAKRYMTAFFTNDLRTAASLMHPKALLDMRSGLLAEMDKYRKAGHESEFYRSMNLDPKINLEELDLQDLYVLILTGARSLDPAATKAMQNATVQIQGSEVISDDKILVTLNLRIGTFVQDSPTMVQRHEDSWKVVMK